MTATAHPFELSGLGVGPFRFLFAVSLPSPSLAEKNPAAFQAALRDLPRDVGCGTCAHCGQAIVHNFVICDSTGRKSAVGSECVAKTGDKALGNKVDIAAAKIVRDARRAKVAAKREAARAAWLVINGPRLEREQAEREAAHAAQVNNVLAEWSFALPALDAGKGSFCESIASDIRNGRAPRGRAAEIVAKIADKWGF